MRIYEQARDVNGDGKADILIGGMVYYYQGSSLYSYSAAYLIYGGNSLSNVNLANLGNSGITITGAGASMEA